MMTMMYLIIALFLFIRNSPYPIFLGYYTPIIANFVISL
jgi:hypothetical protein